MTGRCRPPASSRVAAGGALPLSCRQHESRHEAALLGSRTMVRYASRLAFGVALAAAPRHREQRAGYVRRHRLAEHQLREERQPLQPARSDHRAECRDAAAGLELSSQARRLHRPRCGKTKRFRSSSATRCISPRPMAPIHALDATTGVEKWKFQLPNNDVPSKRGIAYWPVAMARRRRSSSARSSGGLYSIKASDGTLNAVFGENGVVNLKTPEVMQTGMNVAYSLLSSPTIYKNLIIIGAGTGEGAGGSNGGAGPAGDTRAFDARTGKLVWTFHTVPRPGEFGYDTWEENSAKNRSGVNVWGYTSLDEERGILYMPLGAPNNDRVGIDRPGNNLFSSSVVAVDANTGKYLWHFQLVHHDIWDYDTQSAPLLVDLQRDGTTVPAAHHRQQDRIDVHAQSRHRQADLRHRRASGAEERSARRADVADAAVPGEAAAADAEHGLARQSLQGRAAASVVLRAHGGRQQHEARRAVHADRLQPLQHFAAGTGRRHQLLGRLLRSQAASVHFEHQQHVPADAPDPAAGRQLREFRTARRHAPLRRCRPEAAVRADAVGRTGRGQHGYRRHRLSQDARRLRHAARRACRTRAARVPAASS